MEREPNLGNNSTEVTKDNEGRGRWLVVTTRRDRSWWTDLFKGVYSVEDIQWRNGAMRETERERGKDGKGKDTYEGTIGTFDRVRTSFMAHICGQF